MNDDSRREELLNDVVDEAVTPSFRADLFGQMLGEVRRGRARRRNQRLMAGACALIAIVVAVMLLPGNKGASLSRVDPLVVHSEPLVPGLIVATQPGNLTTINSSDSSVGLVEAIPAQNLFEFIGDEKLFALLAGRPAALVQHDTSGAELVFLNPADANGFQVH
jgi:hypothetical protein